MHPSTPHDSPSPSFYGDTTIAAAGLNNANAPRSLTSGFGTVLEKEHELRSATEGYLAEATGPHSTDLDRILRQQQTRIGANIALLEQRYEMLPHAKRFQALHGVHFSPTRARPTAEPENGGTLPNLVAQHRSLIGNLDALIIRDSDGQRGELILTAIGRNHEDMAGVLTALLRADDPARDRVTVPVVAAVGPTPGTTEGSWENEGGASRPTRAPMPMPIGAK